MPQPAHTWRPANVEFHSEDPFINPDSETRRAVLSLMDGSPEMLGPIICSFLSVFDSEALVESRLSQEVVTTIALVEHLELAAPNRLGLSLRLAEWPGAVFTYYVYLLDGHWQILCLEDSRIIARSGDGGQLEAVACAGTAVRA